MKNLLTKKQFELFPSHDAFIYSFLVLQDSEGQTNLIIEIEITDTSYEVDYEIPKNNGITRLVFEKCWLIKNNLICDCANRDSINNFNILTESKDLSELKTRGIKQSVYYFQLELNSGSKIDIIAEKLFLQ
jgi:hypothetical protein